MFAVLTAPVTSLLGTAEVLLLGPPEELALEASVATFVWKGPLSKAIQYVESLAHSV